MDQLLLPGTAADWRELEDCSSGCVGTVSAAEFRGSIEIPSLIPDQGDAFRIGSVRCAALKAVENFLCPGASRTCSRRQLKDDSQAVGAPGGRSSVEISRSVENQA